MNIDRSNGTVFFENKLFLSPTVTRREMMAVENLAWEAWPDKEGKTVSYRTIFNIKKNKQGVIYLIVNFSRPCDTEATICSWHFAPDKLLMGEQNKPEGKVTKRLRQWFAEKTHHSIPVYGSWGHIDAAYDPHNRTATIFCNYRTGFSDEKSWREYCRCNNIRV